MFAYEFDDLATFSVLGAVVIASAEELHMEKLELQENNPFGDVLSKDIKNQIGKWFNFLKHGSRGARSPGEECDFYFLANEEERDLLLFQILWHATLFHMAAYGNSSPIVQTVIMTPILMFCIDDDEDPVEIEPLQQSMQKNIRKLCKMHYEREENALKNSIDLQEADNDFSEMISHLIEPLINTPKREIKNKRSKAKS